MTTPATNLTIVVGGFPNLATALLSAGRFEAVLPVASTSALRDLIKSGSLPRDKSRVVFLFSSTTTVDTPESLEYLVGRLSSAGWRVVILALSATAKDIVNAHPGAGYLEQPISVNQILGALAGMGFVGIDPVEGGFNTIYDVAPTEGGWLKAESAPAPQPTPPSRPESQVTPKPSPQPAPTQPPSGGAWVRPAEPQPVVEQPPARPAQPQGGWSAAQQPQPAPRPVQPQQTPAVARPMPAQPATPPPTQPSWGETVQPGAPSRPLTRPMAPTDTQRSLARPGTQGPIGRRVGSYQDFAPTGPSARRRGHVITVASPKGGTGKSSLSANLAVFLGLSLRGTGRRVALIDANFQQADTGKLLNVYTPNISNILKDEGSLVPERIEQYMIERRDFNASFLLGPATPRDATPTFFNARLYNQVLAVLKQSFDYIIIDTPVAELYHDILRGFALPAADYIVVPITPAIHTLMNADGWLRTITQPRHQGGDEIDPAKIGVVLNQAQDGVDCDEEEVRRELYSWNFIGSVPMTKEWLRANNNNEFVAAKNLPEIVEAFANILYAATGEEVLLQGLIADPNQGKKGILSRLRRNK